MKRPLGLHQITAMELDPLAFVQVAAACGYDHVGLFTNGPKVPLEGRESTFVFPTVTPEMTGELKRLLADNDLAVVNAEFFLMRPDVDLASYIPGLALAREIGAANAITHVFDEDSARAVDILGAFCDLAEAQAMRVAIEFCQMTPGCKTIEQAKWFVDQVGKANLGFGICPMHLMRSGGAAADIGALDARYLFYGQINDGKGLHVSPAYFDEVHNRELPGDGDFPLHHILSALPASAPIEVKLPSDRRRKAGVPAQDFAREAASRSRTLVDGLKPNR